MSTNSPRADRLMKIIMPEIVPDDTTIPPGFEPVEPPSLDLAPVPDWMSDTDFEAAGCSLIDATGIMLAWLGASPEVRHTCLVIAGLSGGDYRNFSEITQARMAQRMGCSLPTIRERLKELWQWQHQTNYCVVEIEKRDYDPEQGQYATTKYRPLIVRYAGHFIRKLRDKGLKPVYRQQAVTEGTEKLIDALTAEVVDEMPEAPRLVDRNRKPSVQKAKQKEIGFIEEPELDVLADLDVWCDRMEQARYIILDHAPKLEQIIHDRLKARGQAQLERMKRQKSNAENVNKKFLRSANVTRQ